MTASGTQATCTSASTHWAVISRSSLMVSVRQPPSFFRVEAATMKPVPLIMADSPSPAFPWL